MKQPEDYEQIYEEYPFYEDERLAETIFRETFNFQNKIGEVKKLSTGDVISYIPYTQISETGILDGIDLSLGGKSPVSIFLYFMLMYVIHTDYKETRTVCIPYSTLKKKLEIINRTKEDNEKLKLPTRESISRNIKILLQKRILARKNPTVGEYWINTSKIFNGKRSKLTNE
jgi:hypothetical protein